MFNWLLQTQDPRIFYTESKSRPGLGIWNTARVRAREGILDPVYSRQPLSLSSLFPETNDTMSLSEQDDDHHHSASYPTLPYPCLPIEEHTCPKSPVIFSGLLLLGRRIVEEGEVLYPIFFWKSGRKDPQMREVGGEP